MRNPYLLLGVRKHAMPAEIKAAFRKLAREIHPDSDPDNPYAEDEFKELSAAYDLLSDPAKRKRFDKGEIDASGHAKPQRKNGAKQAGAGPMSGQRANKSARTIRVNGADVSYKLKVGFLDALRGAKKRISLANGARLEVSVPPGTKDGQTLRLKGQGMAGMGGGKPGDALIDMTIDKHKVFKGEDADVHLDVPVTLQEAVLGARIEVPTVDGMVSLTVPEGSNTGTVLRLRGKGMAKADGKRGDQFIKLQIVLPDTHDAELKEFVSRWSNGHVYEVRSKLDTTA